jgi:hypothetical protein
VCRGRSVQGTGVGSVCRGRSVQEWDQCAGVEVYRNVVGAEDLGEERQYSSWS